MEKINDKFYIGKKIFGGTVVCVDSTNQHGLVVSPMVSVSSNWRETQILCENYRGGGFSNWRIPSEEEFRLIYETQGTPEGYWTSTSGMFGVPTSWWLHPTGRALHSAHPDEKHHVLLVRTF
jgi:hypothetical protein